MRVLSLPAARETTMENMTAHLEELRIDAKECALISKLATDCEGGSCSQGSPNT
jgi:hypothetical protein